MMRDVKERLGHVPALNGLRGVAIALVLAYHVGWLPGGFLGVEIFFVLSGFLITTLLLEEWGGEHRIRLGAFYVRRARRLLPAMVALSVVLFLIAGAAQGTALGAALGAGLAKSVGVCLLYVANIWRAAGHELSTPLRPMWSLAEEEQFYLLWPPLLLLLMRGRVSLAKIAGGLASAALAVMLWRAHLGPGGRSYFGPDTRCDPLLVGCLLAVVRLRWRLPQVGLPVALLALTALATEAITVSGSEGFLFDFGFPLATISTAALIVVALQESSVAARVLSFRPFVQLGVISYGLYIWQTLVLSLFAIANIDAPAYFVELVAIVSSVGVAALSYRYVEQPFRRRRSEPLSEASPEAVWVSRPVRAFIRVPAVGPVSRETGEQAVVLGATASSE
jgi:peptidoglycan/LPS O-acetylase OafA/YrhL